MGRLIVGSSRKCGKRHSRVAGDNVSIIAYGAFNVADVYTQAQSDARYTQKANNLSDLDNAATALTNLGLTATAAELNYVDGVTSNIQTQIDNIDALPSQTGNAGNYLTTDGTTASWAEVSASPTLEAIASGTLANGDVVIINADGTVSAVTENGVHFDPPQIGTESVFETGAMYQTSAAYNSTQNKIVIQYTDISNSSYGTCVIGSISGTTITFQTPVVFASEATFYHAIAYHASEDKMVLTYSRDVVGYIARAYIGTISGDFINLVGAYNVSTNQVFQKAITYDSTSEKVVIAYKDITNSNYGTAIVGTVSGTSFSVGTPVVFNSSSTNEMSITYDANANKTVIAYRDGSNYGNAIVGTVSGTAISFGTPTTFYSNTITSPSITYDSTSQKVVIGYNDSASIVAAAVVGTVSGTSISFGTPVNFDSGYVSSFSAIYDSYADRTIISYANASNGDDGISVAGTVSGTSISFGNPVVFNDRAAYIASAYDSTNNQPIVSYRANNNSGRGTSIAINPFGLVSSLTSENYIGISDAAYSNGATAKVQIVGSVDDAQSGLTAGQSYYVQGDGSLSTTPADPSVFAGTAVSATKLIVKG